MSRLNRRNDSGWGGIASFARVGYDNYVVHVGDSTIAERSWNFIHSDRGPIAVAVWYRRLWRSFVCAFYPAEISEVCRIRGRHHYYRRY